MAKVCAKPGCPEIADEHSYCSEHYVKPQDRPGYVPWKGARKRSRRPWERKRQAVKVRDKGLCQNCRRSGQRRAGHEVDHIKPVFEGGTDEMDNLELICQDCHKHKTAQESARARAMKRDEQGE